MTKNVVICCDGTSNEYNYTRTNVVSLYYTLVNDPQKQVSFYHPGLGTMGPPGALTHFDKWWTRKLGLAFGRGIEDDIRDAYVFLMENFEPTDKLFLFGFSRGAYTARSIASVLYLYGLLHKGNAPLVPYAVRMIVELGSARQKDRSGLIDLAKGFKDTFSRSCPVEFVGVWDTVSSVGWFTNPMKLPNTANNPEIAIGRHAVSIDERRAFFRSNLWWPATSGDSGPKNLKQVWFPGSHSDVGGGYPVDQSGLSQFALEWMIVEARKAGLLVDPDRVNEMLGYSGTKCVRPNAKQEVHNSLTWQWWPAEFVPKPHYDRKTNCTHLRMNLFRRRTMPDGAVIHQSAYLRDQTYQTRLPRAAAHEPWNAFRREA